MEQGFYDVSSPSLFETRVRQAKQNGYVWGSDFAAHEANYYEAKSWFHRNSKLLLLLYYNEICKRKEMVVTTKTVIKSYPQYKGKKIIVL